MPEFEARISDQEAEVPIFTFDRVALERYRALFVARYPDFRSFQQRDGGYFAEERQYKEELLALAQKASSDDQERGARLLDVLTGKAGVSSNLLGWRTNGRVIEIRKTHAGILEAAAGRLARATDVGGAIAEFVEQSWPLFAEGQTSKPYSESRNIPSMLAALVHPDKAYGINTQPVQQAAQALIGRRPFGSNPMTVQEYADVLSMMRSLKDVMADEWGWAPRDLWDIQGFIWATDHADQPNLAVEQSQSPKTDRHRPMSINQIFYGPPGTGKTYQTAIEAVRLCGEMVPAGRDELMKIYRRLVDEGRIEFVTFHQSMSYEDFVECLRPSQASDDGAAGFELKPEQGVFRRIARRAETSTGPGTVKFSIDKRRVFKMSIGEAANPEDDHFFEEAIAGGYTLLGYDDIDWSDPRFADRAAILEAVNAHGPNEGEALNALNGEVQMPFIFRNLVQPADILVVSKGNGYFRAIGEVTGEYQFVPREEGGYAHRRAVRWLWTDRASVPVREIYARNFTQKTIYRLAQADLDVPALERYIASQQNPSSGAPEAFVLIIDEINRANISKVFGELITLLEPDKRIGQLNELTVRLPYSGDRFGVPPNLHIIGTMNTADRSIALLDTALRRRFAFRELMPNASVLRAVDGIDLAKLLTTINERVEYLFDREHQIGHAYFTGCRSQADIDQVMRHKVIPLLAEYFYEDWGKVAAVLGDGDHGGDESEGRFIDRRRLNALNGMGDEGSAERYRWSVRDHFSYDEFATE